MTLNKFREMVEDRGNWHAEVHGIAKSWTQLSSVQQQQKYTVMSKYDWKVLVIYLLSLSSYALLYDAGPGTLRNTDTFPMCFARFLFARFS